LRILNIGRQRFAEVGRKHDRVAILPVSCCTSFIDLEQKLLATKAAAEKQIQALTRERDTVKASQSEHRAKVSTTASNFDQLVDLLFDGRYPLLAHSSLLLGYRPRSFPY
jgi:hypothetical protein